MSYAITWEDVWSRAPELDAVGPEARRAILQRVADEVSSFAWGATRGRLASIELAAHLGTLSLRRGVQGPLTSKKMDTLATTYAAPFVGPLGLELTPYGIEYKRLIRMTAAFRFSVLDGA